MLKWYLRFHWGKERWMITTGTSDIQPEDRFIGLKGEVRNTPKFFKKEPMARQALLLHSGIEKTLEELQ